jgi:hypothetical protein
MKSLLPAWMKNLEILILKETIPRRPHCELPDLLKHTGTSLVARLEWCGRQRTRARTGSICDVFNYLAGRLRSQGSAEVPTFL